MRRVWRYIVIGCWLLAGSAARGDGLRWRVWVDANDHLGAVPAGHYLWAAGPSVIWRVDRRTGDVRAYTDLQGLPLSKYSPTNPTGASDGRFACVIHAAIYQFDAGGEVSCLRPPLQSEPFRIAFGPDDQLYLLDGRNETIWSRKGDVWVPVRPVPQTQNFLPTRGGFVLSSVSGVRGAGFIGREEGEFDPFPAVRDIDFRRPPIYVDGRAYVLGRDVRGFEVLASIRDGKLAVEAEQPVGIDLATGRPLHFALGREGMELAMGGDETMLSVPPAQGFIWRDSDGALWTGATRWDAKQRKWIAHRPPIHIERIDRLTDPQWYRWDAETDGWQRAVDDLGPAHREAFDPATSEFWRSTYRRGEPGTESEPIMEQVKIVDGERRVIRTIDMPPRVSIGLPQFADAAGDWWAVGQVLHEHKFFAVRIDRHGRVHTYPSGPGSAGGWRPQIQRSRSGRVWVWEDKAHRRYDPEADAFVEDEPWADFAFPFGRWTLSLAGPISSIGQVVYRKTNGGWEPLPSPLAGRGARGGVRGAPGMIRGDRMMVNILGPGLGIYEYDAARHRWAYLHGSLLQARFTEDGRRLFTSPFVAFMLEGDPFAARPEDDETMTDASLFERMHPTIRPQEGRK